jgi:hypothetical protein
MEVSSQTLTILRTCDFCSGEEGVHTQAALIRTFTLPHETTFQVWTKDYLVKLWDDASGGRVTWKVAERSGIGNGTKAIVDAMDWSTVLEN